MAKHSVIYPQSEELHAVQEFINTTERALTMLADGKLSSDRFPSYSDSKRFPTLNTICLKCDTDADSDGRWGFGLTLHVFFAISLLSDSWFGER